MGAQDTTRAKLPGHDLELWKAFMRVSQLLPSALDDALRGMGETLPRYEILAVLASNAAGLRMSELGRLALVSKPRLSVHVGELLNEGLVERGPDKTDGRAVVVTITRAGRRHLTRLAPDHVRQARDLVIDCIPPADRPVVLRSLAAILLALGDTWQPGADTLSERLSPIHRSVS
ncbi:MAG: MarR family winged helix-turn-helix transcriptional regulator [Acidimicrobiales bacterium]